MHITFLRKYLIFFRLLFPCIGFIFSGATAPLGFWDPLEISQKVDIGHLAFLREAELKHSRWSMIACVSIPMIETTTHHPAVNEFNNLQLEWKLFIISFVIVGEFTSLLKGWENPLYNITNIYKLKTGYQPGDMGFGVIQKLDFIEHDTINNLELNHGRFAMITSIVILMLECHYDIPLFTTPSLELITH